MKRVMAPVKEQQQTVDADDEMNDLLNDIEGSARKKQKTTANIIEERKKGMKELEMNSNKSRTTALRTQLQVSSGDSKSITPNSTISPPNITSQEKIINTDKSKEKQAASSFKPISVQSNVITYSHYVAKTKNNESDKNNLDKKIQNAEMTTTKDDSITKKENVVKKDENTIKKEESISKLARLASTQQLTLIMNKILRNDVKSAQHAKVEHNTSTIFLIIHLLYS